MNTPVLANAISISLMFHLVPHPRSQKKPHPEQPYAERQRFFSSLEDGIKEISSRFYRLLGETRMTTRPRGNQPWLGNRERDAPVPALAPAHPACKHPTVLSVAISKGALFRIKTTVTGPLGTGHRAALSLTEAAGLGSPFAPLLQ